MHAGSPPRGWAQLLTMVDAPARHAFLLAGRPVVVPAAMALAAAVVVAGVGALGAWLTRDAPGGGGALGLLAIEAGALAMVVPGAVILGAYAGLPLTPRAWLGGVAVALVTAAVVLVSGVPFLLYLALVSRAGAGALPDLLLAGAALVAVAATLARVVRAAEPGPRGAWAARLFTLALTGAALAQALAPRSPLQAILHNL